MAVRAPDPHNLRAAAQRAAGSAIIDSDRPCLGCGYNLRGLRAGINCPECGLPSVLPEDVDDPLALMPRSVIVAFIIGCWSASICVMLIVGLVVVLRLEIAPAEVMVAALAVVSMAWLGATILITPAFALPQAVKRGFALGSRLRRASRWLQLGWPVLAGATLLKLAAPNASASLANLLLLLQIAGFLSGMAGIVALCVLLQQLADWTRDDGAGTAFNWAMWSLPIATVLILIMEPAGGWAMPARGLVPMDFLVHALWFAALCTLPYGLLNLSKSVTLSIVHSFEHEDRQRRKTERDRKQQEKLSRMLKG
jgi:hypothetical protein